MDLALGGKKAIVTGGSKGLGRAIAEELAREGADIALCARNVEEVARTGEELSTFGTKVFARTADVTDPDQVESFIQETATALGGIDILVNNAGRAKPGSFESLSDEDWKEDLQVKLFSMIRCARAVLPHMRRRGGGRIININAVHAKAPDYKFFATSTNRAACLAFTKTLAQEVAGDNILVNAVNIGFVVTPQWQNIHRQRSPELSEEEFFDQMATDIPLGRFGRADEVSGIVAFLAGERSSFITGTDIDVAGGMGRYL